MKRGDLVRSALKAEEFPTEGWQEVALLGRSNAGKSSLLNALLGTKAAHISGTPGRTQRINFFYVDRWFLVDLPGFGYAQVPLAVKAAFSRAVDAYLNERAPLTAAILIQDIRRTPGSEELMLRDWARERNILLVVCGNKADKLSKREKEERVAALTELYGQPVHPTSCLKRQGLEPIQQELRGLGLTGLAIPEPGKA
jgi:GTP-binding protein